MTEPKRTMMLSPAEWRVIVATGANNIYSFIGQMPADTPPDATQSTWLHDTLDRLKIQVSAWQASGQQQPFVPDNVVMRKAGADIEAGDLLMENGSGSVVPAGPKKKRGWQKGRKRGPRKPRTDEAVQ